MARVNSWGRPWKRQISVTFKKDEQIMEDFINEKVDPTSYIKELILKDMRLIKNSANSINNIENNDKFNDEVLIDPDAAKKLDKMMDFIK